MGNEWFVKLGDREAGPLTDSMLRSWAAEGKLLPSDMVHKAGGPRMMAGQIKGLAFPVLNAHPSAAQAVAAPAPPIAAGPIPVAIPVSAVSRPAKQRKNAVLPITAAVAAVAGIAAGAFLLGRNSGDQQGPPTPGAQQPGAPLSAAPVSTKVAAQDPRSTDPRSVPAGSTPSPTSGVNLVMNDAIRQAGSATEPQSSLGVLYGSAPSATPTPSAVAPQVSAAGGEGLASGPSSGLSPAAALEKLKPWLAIVDIDFGDTRDRSVGLILGKSGEVVRCGTTLWAPETVRVTSLADGTTVEAEGYTAEMMAKHLVQFKTKSAAPDGFPAVKTGPRIGQAVYLLWLPMGANAPQLLPGGVVVEEPSNLFQLTRSVLRDPAARVFAVELPATASTFARHMVLDEQGNPLGFSVMRESREGRRIACVEASHIRDLASHRRTDVGKWTDLASPQAAKIAEQSRRSTPTARATATGSTTTASTTTGPTATASTATASTAGASTGSPTTTPRTSPATMATAAAGKSAGGKPTDPVVWLAEVQAVLAQRKQMFAENDAIEARRKPLIEEAAALDKQFRALEEQARPITARLTWLANKISAIQFLKQQSKDPIEKINMDTEIRIFSQEQLQLNQRYQQIDLQARDLRKKFEAVKVKMQVEDIQSKALGEKAAGLRSDFVTLLSPLDASAPPRGQAADAYFTELIEGDKDAEIGYFCRGCLRLQQGELSTAVADLDSTINYNAKDSIYRTVRAAAYFRSGRDADGRKDLAEALKLDKKNAWIPYVTALSYFKNGAYSAIEAQLRESMKLNPKFVEALALMALIKSTAVDDKFRNADYALKTAQTAVSAAPTPSCTAHLALAVAYAETDDFVQALRYADAALATAAPGPQADWCRACRKAVEEKKAVRIDWKTADIWTRL